MAVITERGVPMQSSSQVMAFRMSVGMGRMWSSRPHAIAQVTTTAQLSQCFDRVEGIERDGHTCWLKASMRPRTEGGAVCAMLPMAGVQCPLACSRTVGSLRFRRMAVVSTPAKGGAAVRSGRLVRKGIPPLRDHLARFPKPAPRRMVTEARNAAWCPRSRRAEGAMLLVCEGESGWRRVG